MQNNIWSFYFFFCCLLICNNRLLSTAVFKAHCVSIFSFKRNRFATESIIKNSYLSKKLEELIVQESNFGNTNVTIVRAMLYAILNDVDSDGLFS